jgi:hypothetical protein
MGIVGLTPFGARGRGPENADRYAYPHILDTLAPYEALCDDGRRPPTAVLAITVTPVAGQVASGDAPVDRDPLRGALVLVCKLWDTGPDHRLHRWHPPELESNLLRVFRLASIGCLFIQRTCICNPLLPAPIHGPCRMFQLR